jgi:prepilin-type N-terminal cleavage/methylation domain-containing protein
MQMKLHRKQSTKGFSLVELLAVVLVLAVLAAVAIPLYTSQRKSAAGRTCKANITAIAAAMSGYALRADAYPTVGDEFDAFVAGPPISGGLIGSPEGLTEEPKCPLDGDSYTIVNAAGGRTITCPNDASHATYGGTAGSWTKSLSAPATDSLP